jgi:hypothetical protein
MENKKNLENVLIEIKTEKVKENNCGYCEKPIKGTGYRGPDSKFLYCDSFCYMWDTESEN